MVADGKLLDSLADRLDDPGAIRHRNAAILGRHLAGDHAIVVEVEGTGMDADANVARPGRAGLVHVDEGQAVETAGMCDADGFHLSKLSVDCGWARPKLTSLGI